MSVLITGITGFAGSHLADYFVRQGRGDIYGTVRVRSRMEHIEHLRPHVNLVECELKSATSVDALIRKVRPAQIFHLAAQSFVPTSWNSPEDTLVNNVMTQLNLFESVRRNSLPCRIQIACSSEEYGHVLPEETPINEENPLRPLSPYGVSKVTQDLLAYQYFQSHGLDVVRTRTFNHEGPRRGEAFVLSNFAKQIAQIEAGLQKPILEVGNLDAIRDFTDVRDVVRAYVLALEHGRSGEIYNIGSGNRIRIGDALDQLLALTTQPIRVQQVAARMRPSDVMILHCDARKFMKATGWRPHIPFHQTLQDLLSYWRARVRRMDNTH